MIQYDWLARNFEELISFLPLYHTEGICLGVVEGEDRCFVAGNIQFTSRNDTMLSTVEKIAQAYSPALPFGGLEKTIIIKFNFIIIFNDEGHYSIC